ncbi:MAG: hypothetical protein AB7P99_00300 [Vicinamibacterales bacterium]
MKHPVVAAVVVLLPVLATAPARAQQPAPARVQLHVGGDPDLRQPALTHLRAALQPTRDIVLVDREPEYVLSVIVLPIASGGFALSAAALSAHTGASLAALANLWGLGAPVAERMAATFRGQGALLDQRVLTGPELEPLCGDVARAFAADTLARARKP